MMSAKIMVLNTMLPLALGSRIVTVTSLEMDGDLVCVVKGIDALGEVVTEWYLINEREELEYADFNYSSVLEKVITSTPHNLELGEPHTVEILNDLELKSFLQRKRESFLELSGHWTDVDVKMVPVLQTIVKYCPRILPLYSCEGHFVGDWKVAQGYLMFACDDPLYVSALFKETYRRLLDKLSPDEDSLLLDAILFTCEQTYSSADPGFYLTWTFRMTMVDDEMKNHWLVALREALISTNSGSLQTGS